MIRLRLRPRQRGMPRRSLQRCRLGHMAGSLQRCRLGHMAGSLTRADGLYKLWATQGGHANFTPQARADR